MTGPERLDAFRLMQRFRSDERALGDALALFADREDYGFVWLAYLDDELAGCASAGYAIATDAGGIVAHVSDLYVLPEARRCGVGRALVTSLRDRFAQAGIVRVDVAAGSDPGLRALLAATGFTVAQRMTFTMHLPVLR
jgi:GNAT superfamily N-acetyltransferase